MRDGIFDTVAALGGRMSGLASQQDGGQFEDALRRLHALEKKLTDQVRAERLHLAPRLLSGWTQDSVRDE